MKRMMICCLVLLLCGCAYTQEEVKSFIADPHFSEYKQQLDDLERSYLHNEVSYPVYLKRKQEIETRYSKEVQEREEIIHQTPYE